MHVVLQIMVFANFATICNTQSSVLVKFPVIVDVDVAISLVNKDEYRPNT